MIKEVWERIKEFEGETFYQIRGGEFTYQIKGNALLPSRTNRLISKSVLNEVLQYLPLETTGPVHHLQGPSFLHAILMDDRVRRNDW